MYFRNFLRLVRGARLDRRELLVILRADGRVRAVVEQSAQQGRQPPDHKRCQQHKITIISARERRARLLV